jgi:plasmid stabilization system protein ParE
MPDYELTTRAREDLREVARYTLTKWGIKQARRYRQRSRIVFRQLEKRDRWAHIHWAKI